MTQRIAQSHAEAIANSIVGAAIAQLILWSFDIPVVQAVSLNAVMIGASYARAFVLRRIFGRAA